MSVNASLMERVPRTDKTMAFFVLSRQMENGA